MFKLKIDFFVLNIILFSGLSLLFIDNNQVMAMENNNKTKKRGI
ncbi:SVM family protein [Candidatus Phytoplasma australiense]|uniref:Sequence-variable mosaic (SVM) signal sequence domain-containing protein n=1 Tax=Strawberry lethal yellows phytoplasma (CPA) str. NZSb11 TaxID=980422 RepID=R4S203_PHYAS|nr:SVM family protein [Candidatus Phytoplasma australiense]AGL90849.1 Hypothetical Protein SLY_0934 [Strawberry lethal yellows phytoplasma (CPA) str. NZSb11]